MKKSAIFTTGAIGVVGIALLTAIAQANVKNHAQLSSIDTDMRAATRIAVEAVTGDVVEAELELDDGYAVWEVEIIDELNRKISVEIDGRTGEVLSTEVEGEQSDVQLDSITLTQAIEAVTAIEKGVFVEAELETEKGDLIWEIEAIGPDNREHEFQVDATTGTVI